MTKHTPGPWEADQHPGSREVYIRPAYKGYGADSPALAEAFSQDSSTEAERIQWVNAHLIAAAPEMLEALREFAEGRNNAHAMELCYAAIAKAEGRA
jgi:hypothetical protein